MNTQLISVPFHGQSLLATLVNDIPHVAMKPICENIGVDWKSQHRKITTHPVLSKGMVMVTTPSNGGLQEMLMLPVKLLNGWLFGIDSNRVKPEIQDRLVEYQTECFEVLANHFMPKADAAPDFLKPITAPITLAEYEQRAKSLQTAQNALRGAQVIMSGADIQKINDKLNNTDTMSIFSGLFAVNGIPAEKERYHHRWSESDKQQLAQLHSQGLTHKVIAAKIGRTRAAVKGAIKKFLTEKAGA